jgi:hypothetical protein
LEKVEGNLAKMAVTLENTVGYRLPVSETRVGLNELIGSHVTLTFLDQIDCINCGRKIKKSYNQGYCFPCSQKLAACDICIVKPELCHYDRGTCREPEWGDTHCMQPHIVYLANTSGIKVGITRKSQVPTRWIDQGAVQALPVYEVSSRFQAGLLEVAIKDFVADKTDWRKLLKGPPEPVDLIAKRNEIWSAMAAHEQNMADRFQSRAIRRLDEAQPVNIQYPVEAYPDKVKSYNFDKTPQVSGVLNGIKGQYLLLDGGVLNIRKFTGYRIAFQARA